MDSFEQTYVLLQQAAGSVWFGLLGCSFGPDGSVASHSSNIQVLKAAYCYHSAGPPQPFCI